MYFKTIVLLASTVYTLANAVRDEDGEFAQLINYINVQNDVEIVLRNANLTPQAEDLSTNITKHVLYFLYTNEYNKAFQVKKYDNALLKRSTYNVSRPTKMVIHGFGDSYLSVNMQTLRDAYVNPTQDVNLILVDWSYLCFSIWYTLAVDRVRPVGQEVGEMIDWLVSEGADLDDFHIIGHSLGAHVCGFTGDYVTSGSLTRISGLDPALPLFSDRGADERLDPSDADLVDCIHTCGGFKGFYQPICTTDFYPNGGKKPQPGCNADTLGVCSHARSVHLFAESVNDTFTAVGCSSLNQVEDKTCKGHVGVMGDRSPGTAPGIYYLETNSKSPFAKS